MANGNRGSFLQTFKQVLVGREEEEIFLGRPSREQRAETSSTNTQDAIEEKGEKMADRPACGFFRMRTAPRTSQHDRECCCVSQAHLHTGNKAPHSLPNRNAFLLRGQRHAHSGNMCSTIY